MRTSNQHLFSQVPSVSIERSTFDRTHKYMTAFDSGYLIPFYVDEVLPGDTFKASVNLFARMSTPVVPIMDNLYLETFFFYVPARILWDNFEKFMGSQDNPGDSTDYLMPTIANNSGFAVGSLYDYMGIPPNVAITDNNPIQSLPLRAYNLIYNEWFRSELLQDSVPFTTGDGPDPVSNYTLLRSGKNFDYFTSATPSPQKGPAEGITINLGQSAPISGTLTTPATTLYASQFQTTGGSDTRTLEVGARTNRGSDDGGSYNGNILLGQVTTTSTLDQGYSLGTDVRLVVPAPSLTLQGSLTADLSLATAITINDLRTAFQLQKLLERDMLSGTRYKELLLGHFGVVSPDGRLQRPEYLGGSRSRVNIKPVEQTSSTDSTSPQGNLAAYGVVGDSYHGFTKSFVEHGFIIGLMRVRADLTYQQGLNRMWSRRDRFDHYWPVLAHLGEQAILNQEIMMQGTAADQAVFGYQERWAEYRYKPNLITGKMRSGVDGSLDVWHLGQYFESLPQLNDEFIVENAPLQRALAVQDEPQFIFDSEIRLKSTRPMPVYSVPGFVDHF